MHTKGHKWQHSLGTSRERLETQAIFKGTQQFLFSIREGPANYNTELKHIVTALMLMSYKSDASHPKARRWPEVHILLDSEQSVYDAMREPAINACIMFSRALN
eukprot:1162072-Pelagomonas_calceolata.AAC.3